MNGEMSSRSKKPDEFEASLEVAARMESIGNKESYTVEEIRYLGDQLAEILAKVPGVSATFDLSSIPYPEERDRMYSTDDPGRPGVSKIWEKGHEGAGPIAITTAPENFTSEHRQPS